MALNLSSNSEAQARKKEAKMNEPLPEKVPCKENLNEMKESLGGSCGTIKTTNQTHNM